MLELYIYRERKGLAWCDHDVGFIFVVTEDAGHPSIQAVGACPNALDAEVAIFIGFTPKLVALSKLNH